MGKVTRINKRGEEFIKFVGGDRLIEDIPHTYLAAAAEAIGVTEGYRGSPFHEVVEEPGGGRDDLPMRMLDPKDVTFKVLAQEEVQDRCLDVYGILQIPLGKYFPKEAPSEWYELIVIFRDAANYHVSSVQLDTDIDEFFDKGYLSQDAASEIEEAASYEGPVCTKLEFNTKLKPISNLQKAFENSACWVMQPAGMGCSIVGVIDIRDKTTPAVASPV